MSIATKSSTVPSRPTCLDRAQGKLSRKRSCETTQVFCFLIWYKAKQVGWLVKLGSAPFGPKQEGSGVALQKGEKPFLGGGCFPS